MRRAHREVLAPGDVLARLAADEFAKTGTEKLKSGDVYQVAEVVRNLALRDAAKGLSAGEKNMYTKARKVLVSELSFALNVSDGVPEPRDLKVVSDVVLNVQTGTGNRIELWDAHGTPLDSRAKIRKYIDVRRLNAGR